MNRRLVAVVAVCLAAGCSTAARHRPAPSTRTPASPADASPARIFAGCTLGSAGPDGWSVECGKESAAWVAESLGRASAQPARAIASYLMSQQLTRTDSSRRTLSLRLAGSPRPVTVVTLRKKGGERPASAMSLVSAAFDLPAHRHLALFCLTGAGSALNGCSPILAWMAAHPLTPPKNLRSGPHATWPAAKDLARLKGCRVVRRSSLAIDLKCGSAVVQASRVSAGDAAQSSTGPRLVAGMVGAALKSWASAPVQRDEVPCRIGGALKVCERIRARRQGSVREVLGGYGTVLGGPALVLCQAMSKGRADAGACAPFIVQPPGDADPVAAASPPPPAAPRNGKPEGKPTGAFTGCKIYERQPQGYQVECGRVVANVLRAEAGVIGSRAQYHAVREAMSDHLDRPPTHGTRQVVLAGRPRAVAVLTFPDGRTDKEVAHTRLLAFVRLSPAHLVRLQCTAPGTAVHRRCLDLLAAMARRPWPLPPGAHLLGTHRPDPFTPDWARSYESVDHTLTIHGHGPAATGPAWPPAKDLRDPGLSSCSIRRVDRGQVVMSCRQTFVVLKRLAGGGAPSGEALAATRKGLAGLAARLTRSQLGVGGTARPVPCKVGGEATTCQRVRVSDGQSATDVTFGAGPILGAPTLVECLDQLPGRSDPPGCDDYLEAPPGLPPPMPPVPAFSWIPKPLQHPPRRCVYQVGSDLSDLTVICGRRSTNLFITPGGSEAKGPGQHTADIWMSVEADLSGFVEDGRRVGGVDWHACTFDGERGLCASVHYQGDRGPETDLMVDAVMGGKRVNLTCTWPGNDETPKGVCAKVVSLGRAIPPPPKPARWHK